jgi:hypothetical protein
MAIPNIPEFLKIAQMLNGMVPELSAIIKPAVPIFKAAKDSAGFSRNLTNVAKRANFIEGEFALNKGQPGRVATVLKKSADEAKKVADATKKVQDAFFKNMPGGATPKNGGIAGGQLLGIVLQGGLALAVINNILIQNSINDAVDRQLLRIGLDGSKIFTSLGTLYSRVKNLDIKFDTKIQKFERELTANAKDYLQLNKQQEATSKNAVEVKQKVNDALYETRQGRTILETKISEAKKQSNDALYEARTNKQNLESQVTGLRSSFEAKIQSINAQISKFNASATEAVQKSLSTTISKVQADLAATKAQVNAIKQTDTASITANAVAAAKAIVAPLQAAVGALSNQTNGIATFATLAGVAINGVANLAQAVSTANENAESTRKYVDRALVPRIEATVTQSTGVTAGMARLERENQETRTYVEKVLATVTPSTGITAEMGRLERENQETRTYVERTLVPRIEATVTQSTGVAAEFAEVKQQIPALSTQIKQSQTQISDLNKKLTEQEKVNQQALPKLDQIVGILGLIPARAAAAIRPDIPTIPQIETAAATGTCRTTQPGGCMSKALNDNATNIANNNNTNASNILGAVNAVGQGADLALLGVINNKLGDQVPGGLSGFLGRGFKWLQLDRVLNVLIFITTVHNAGMLSNNLAQTLLQAIGNGLTLIGIKDENGNALDLNTLLGGAVSSVLQGILGAENYATLSAAWTKASRIYQAGANVIRSFTSMSDVILNAIEYLAGQSAKVGNALRNFRVVGERAYEVFNPQPNLKWGIFSKLQKGQESADFILQVSQVPIDVIQAGTDFTQSATELTKAKLISI